jgi:hypothetical protein
MSNDPFTLAETPLVTVFLAVLPLIPYAVFALVTWAAGTAAYRIAPMSEAKCSYCSSHSSKY